MSTESRKMGEMTAPKNMINSRQQNKDSRKKNITKTTRTQKKEERSIKNVRRAGKGSHILRIQLRRERMARYTQKEYHSKKLSA